MIDGHIDEPKGMSDEEIIKALECIGNLSPMDFDCDKCTFEHCDNCQMVVAIKSLDLIKRYKAENEELKAPKYPMMFRSARGSGKSSRILREYTDDVRAEAVKEFAERLKNKSESCTDWGDDFVLCEDIDNLVKEMVGDTE